MQKEEINREIERNASKLETSTEGRNHVKQRERNSRGDGGRVAILRKETEEIFRSYRVKFIWALPLSLSFREKCTLMMQEGRETKRGKEMLVHSRQEGSPNLPTMAWPRERKSARITARKGERSAAGVEE